MWYNEAMNTKRVIRWCVVIAVALSLFAVAEIAGASIGDYAGVGCDTGPTYCTLKQNSTIDYIQQRIHNNEVDLYNLKQENAALKAQIASMQQIAVSGVSTSNTSQIEARVSALEASVRSIQQQVMPVLQAVVGMLAKLIR